jgi:hypothetical protein
MYSRADLYEAVPAEQRQLPSLYLTQDKGNLIDAGAPTHSLVLAYGKDDPEFETLITRAGGESVDVYVLARTTSYVYNPDPKTWKWISREEFDAYKSGDESRDAWVVFRYVVLVDGQDEPARWMLTKTGGLATARAVNTKIDKSLKESGDGLVAVKLKIEKKFGRVSGADYSALVVLPTQGTDDGFARAGEIRDEFADSVNEVAPPTSTTPAF